MPRILLVDDDIELCRMLAEYLTAENFEIQTTHDGESGANQALTKKFDVVVLDIMLPKLNGLDALRQIRSKSQVPVIMLTAKGDDVNRIVGLELGADDYLPKPFNPRELVARLRAILRRTQSPAPQPDKHSNDPIKAGDVQLRPGERIAQWRGNTLELTSTEYSLLEILVRNAGQVVSKSDLSEQALGRPQSPYDRNIDVHISNLRQKLGNLEDGRSPIQTVRNIGYQFIVG
jgi:two-component system response regulator CpxR